MTAVLPVRVDIGMFFLNVSEIRILIAISNFDNQMIFHKIYSKNELIFNYNSGTSEKFNSPEEQNGSIS